MKMTSLRPMNDFIIDVSINNNIHKKYIPIDLL